MEVGLDSKHFVPLYGHPKWQLNPLGRSSHLSFTLKNAFRILRIDVVRNHLCLVLLVASFKNLCLLEGHYYVICDFFPTFGNLVSCLSHFNITLVMNHLAVYMEVQIEAR